jgi:hypothetical protein
MSADEQYEDPTIGPEDFSPEDFRDPLFPAGKYYGCEIIRATRGRNPEKSTFAPNAKNFRVEYRMSVPGDPDLDGKPFKPMPMVTDPGSNFGFVFWLRSMGVDTDKPFTFSHEDYLGMRVDLKLSQKSVGKGATKRMVNNIDEISPSQD